MQQARITAGTLASAIATWAFCAGANTITFPHSDERYLRAGQRDGGAAYVPKGLDSTRAVPIAVMLHGTNSSAALHVWLGGAGRDLRPLVDELIAKRKAGHFILAAPSQTRLATLPNALWREFDLGAFVSDVSKALGTRARVDRRKVILLGHSAAGCNPSGGLASDFNTSGALQPAAIVTIDPCLDGEMGRAFDRATPEVPLFLYWQSQVWQRDLWAWLTALSDREPELSVRLLRVDAPNPHDAVVPVAFARAMRELVPVHQRPRSALRQ